MKIVIIGYGPATIKALEAINRHADALPGERPEVSVISYEKANAYGPMFLIKYITGQLTEDQLSLLPEGHRYSFPLKKMLGKRAIRVNERKSIILEDGQEIGFDKLLIASGASPIIPPITGLTKKGVFFLSPLDNAIKIRHAIEHVSNVLIVGAGAMGMEAAIAFNRLGKRTKVLELTGQILPQALGPHLAHYFQEKLEAQGIEFYLDEAASEISGHDIATGVVTKEGKSIDGDLILITAGVMPNIDIVKSTAIKTNRGILVNDRMETSVIDVYAAGDVAESRNQYNDYEVVFNWYSAISQGWVAGCNLMGQEKSYRFSPMLSALKETDIPVISIGKKRENRSEIFSHRDERGGTLEEIYLGDNYIDCYQAIGTKDRAGLIYSFIKNRKRVDKLKKALLCNDFNAVQLIS